MKKISLLLTACITLLTVVPTVCRRECKSCDKECDTCEVGERNNRKHTKKNGAYRRDQKHMSRRGEEKMYSDREVEMHDDGSMTIELD